MIYYLTGPKKSKKRSVMINDIRSSRWQQLAWILILIVDAGIIAWGAMAALAPAHLPGPGSVPILQAEYEGFTGQPWSALTGTSIATADFITVIFRMYGTFNVVYGLMAAAITVTAFRRGERWAWWAQLVGHTIALGAAITFDRVVNAIGLFEITEYVGLLLVYVALALTLRSVRTSGVSRSSIA
jgi:hypothetical protein